MNTFSVIIYVAFAIVLLAFAYTLWRQIYGEKKTGTVVRRTAGKAYKRPTAITSGEILNLLPKLRDTNSQWPEIMKVLNPNGDQRTTELLLTIRGPHMFDPRTALGVIEDGCRATARSASSSEALTAAVDSMNKVVGFGR